MTIFELCDLADEKLGYALDSNRLSANLADSLFREVYQVREDLECGLTEEVARDRITTVMNYALKDTGKYYGKPPFGGQFSGFFEIDSVYNVLLKGDN